MQEKFGFLYEGFKIKFKIARFYIFFGIFKRCSCCLVLFVFDGMS